MRQVSDDASVFAFRMWWRAWDSSEWLPGSRLLVHVSDSAGVTPEHLSWGTEDGAQSALGFSPDMANCYGHRRAAGGDVVELRGELDGTRDDLEDGAGAGGYEFDTEAEDADGRHPAGRLRLLIDDGDEAPLRWAAWRDQRGNTCSIALRSVSSSGNTDVTDMVTGVWASAEHRHAGEVAVNLVDGTFSKWFAPHSRASLEFRLTRPIEVNRYVLTTANDAPDRDPAAWTLSGSVDGRLWQTLDTRAHQPLTDRHQSRTYRISEPGPHAHYRLDITGNHGSPHLQLAAIRFLTDSGGFIGHRRRAGHGPAAYRGVRAVRAVGAAPLVPLIPAVPAEPVIPAVAAVPAVRESPDTPSAPLPGEVPGVIDPPPAFEDSAPAADITPERPLHRKGTTGTDKGQVTHTVTREPDGSLQVSDGTMSYSLSTPLARWLEQDNTVLTWRQLPIAQGTDLTLCLIDSAGNPRWRESWANTVTTLPPAVPHNHGGPVMGLGSRLRHQSLTSPSGSHTLLHHTDGNLALYCNATHTPVWTTGTSWLGDSWVDLTPRGDLVLRTSCGAPVWQSDTADTDVEQLAVRDDGSLALLHAAGTAVWHTRHHTPCTAAGHTPPRGAVLRRGQTLRNQSLTSADGDTVLHHRAGDGLRLFRTDGIQLWYAPDSRDADAGLTLDDEGFLQIRSDDGTVLAQLAGPGDRLIVVPGGEVRLCAPDGTVLWRQGEYVIDGSDDIVTTSSRMVAPAALSTLLNSLSTPIVRTDFSDDDAWETAWGDITAPRKYHDEDVVLGTTLVAQPDFDGWTGEELATLLSDHEHHVLVMVVDAVTLASPEHPVLVVEVDSEHDQPRSFRATPHALVDVEIQLSIANMDWEDFSESVDPDGVLRTSTGA
ncbi:DUF6924 domain-containing protein [Streptomyces acidicola]|uniref:DUF6924 domain-containing protein n=1 Tax=Streptomyces acidicola TaxID=2596892 RepID=UPI00342A7DB8